MSIQVDVTEKYCLGTLGTKMCPLYFPTPGCYYNGYISDHQGLCRYLWTFYGYNSHKSPTEYGKYVWQAGLKIIFILNKYENLESTQISLNLNTWMFEN